jgi:hypothetical protein
VFFVRGRLALMSGVPWICSTGPVFGVTPANASSYDNKISR